MPHDNMQARSIEYKWNKLTAACLALTLTTLVSLAFANHFGFSAVRMRSWMVFVVMILSPFFILEILKYTLMCLSSRAKIILDQHGLHFLHLWEIHIRWSAITDIKYNKGRFNKRRQTHNVRGITIITDGGGSCIKFNMPFIGKASYGRNSTVIAPILIRENSIDLFQALSAFRKDFSH
ncbi:MAG TPA: hypothetical protein VEH84_02640 [Alphaproteobacteria bacterium]|nr:hypothetical protein [Alphaproteobacteria bacterium]